MENIDIIFPEWISMGNNRGLMMSQNEYMYNPPLDAATTVFRNIRIEGKVPGLINLKPNSEYDRYDPQTNTNPVDSDKIQLKSMDDLGWMGNMLFENISVERQIGDKEYGMRTNLIQGAKTIGKTKAPIVKDHPEAIWWMKDITFRNLTIGGVKVSEKNKDTWFNIDSYTAKNIVFENTVSE